MVIPINSEIFFHYLWGLTNVLFNCKFGATKHVHKSVIEFNLIVIITHHKWVYIKVTQNSNYRSSYFKQKLISKEFITPLKTIKP